jgi:hypothetical protein
MVKRIAVVFDSAGTLLRMYRVAKEASTGTLLENIESTAIVSKKKWLRACSFEYRKRGYPALRKKYVFI